MADPTLLPASEHLERNRLWIGLPPTSRPQPTNGCQTWVRSQMLLCMGTREMGMTHAVRDGSSPPIDVLIVVALEDEFDAVVAEGGGATAWREIRDGDGLVYRVCVQPNHEGKQLGIAVAWTGAMGTAATAARATSLLRDLQPSCIAMCGICAGKRGEVSLGDVIVADRIYSFDHGKLVAAHAGAAQAFFHDLAMYNLERTWHMDAAAFRRDLGWAAHLLPRRPPQKASQRQWLLHAAYAHELEGGPAPVAHPERAAVFPIDATGRSPSDWAERIQELREQKLMQLVAGGLKLTELGRQVVDEDRILYPDGLPREPPFEVHVGPIATGNAVIEDPQIFEHLKHIGRKTLGVEMEAYAIGYMGDTLPQRAIVAKAVSDHGDHDRDGRFREFACRASAAWLLTFLKGHVVPKEPASHAGATDPEHRGPRSPFPDLELGYDLPTARIVLADENRLAMRAAVADDRSVTPVMLVKPESCHLDEFHRRTHRALGLRLPEARLAWKRGPEDAPPAARVFLEVQTFGGGYTRMYPVALVDGVLDRSILDGYVEHIVRRYRADTPYLEAHLIHNSVASDDLIDEAHKRGVRLESVLELNGLLDFRPYVAEQIRTLERDTVYPSRLYVRQRLSYGTGRDERSADDALQTLDRWLGDDGPQLLLVLGDFGTGKTFLMHELALRLGRRDGATVPILVELRKLEKARSLDALLGQHFIPDRGMKRFDYEVFRYMLEEGRIVLMFDGFDELALRVTYETAAEHLDTILQAAIGKAKIVITSRTQHFINDQQVINALGERVTQRGFRMARLLPFDESRIRQFLSNRFNNDAVARGWFDLLGEVKDLLGLSHNPRMLSFIAEIPEQDLRRAHEGGEITSATLYRVLLEKWLGHEVRRAHPVGLSAGSRWKAVTELAVLLWPRKERAIAVGEIPPAILEEVAQLAESPLGTDAVAHKLGSGTLLVRDEDGRFSFIHHSIVEWLVANAAVDDLQSGRDCALLMIGEMSDLMADFLTALAGREAAQAWATRSRLAASNDVLIANAYRLLRRLHVVTEDELASVFDVAFDMSSQDLRGQDFSATSYLRAGLLKGSNLSDALLVRADLSEAVLVMARLQRANLQGANLRDADLRAADLSFARLLGADLTGSKLARAKLRYAKLVGAKLDPNALRNADTFGAALASPRRFDLDRGLPVATCTSIAWSPDGVILALGYRDGTVVLAEAATGRSVRQLESHPYAVNCIVFSRDGKRLASGSDDHSVRLWDPETGALLRSLEHHDDRVTCVAFSPNGEHLASGSDDRTVALWDPATGVFLRSLKAHFHAVTSIAFSADTNLLAAATNQSVDLWSVELGVRLRTLSGHFGQVTTVAFSPTGELVASGSVDRTVLLWDAATGALLRSLSAHLDPVTGVAFSSDGKVLASGCADRTVRLWSPATGALIRQLECDSRVCSIAFSPDSRLLAAGSEDQIVRIWSPEAGMLVRSLKGTSDWVNCVVFSPDGRCFASGSRDRAIRLWNLGVRPALHPIQSHSAWVNSIVYSPDGKLLVSGSSDRTVRLWNLETGALARSFEGHSDCVNSVAFSSDGSLVASGSNDGTVRLWNISPGELVQSLNGHSARVNSVAFSTDGKLLASGSDDQTVKLWDPATATLVRSLRGHSAWVNRIAFSPDGKILASGSEDKTVRLWNPETGTLRRFLLEGFSACISSIAFSPDSRLLATGSFKTVQLWSPDQGKRLRLLEAHSHWVNSIAFSPDGKLFATGSSDGTIRMWGISSALRDDGSDPCLAIIVPGRGGWSGVAPDGRYKIGGNAASSLGFSIGLCRFEPGELDAYPDAFDDPLRRISDEEPLFTIDER